MSGTALADSAPLDVTAVTSVEDMAPAGVREVVDGSARTDEELIPVSRFNGLMGKFNQTQNELTRARNELESLRNAQQEQPVIDTSGLEQQVATLTQMLVSERAENTRSKLLEKYPEVKPFADLFVGEVDEDFVRSFSEKLKTQTVVPAPEVDEDGEPLPLEAHAPVTPAPVGAAPAAPVVPVAPGGATFAEGPSVDERLTDAVKSKDFAAYLRALDERTVLSLNGQLEGA